MDRDKRGIDPKYTCHTREVNKSDNQHSACTESMGTLLTIDQLAAITSASDRKCDRVVVNPNPHMDEECTDNQSSSNESKRIYGIDYLRAFNILGTVIVHSCLAYSPAIQERLSSGMRGEIPLIDYATKFTFMDILIVLRSTYSMQLMFLISGLFSWISLSKRGEFNYIIERLKRLGLPFLAGIFILLPLAYYPGYLLEREHPSSFLLFLKSYLLQGPYHGLHLWFLWLLVGFDFVITVTHYLLRPFKIKQLQLKMGLLLICLSLLIGILINKLLAQTFGPYNWIHIYGPFDLHLDVLPLYFSYFVCGCLLGNVGLNKLIECFKPRGHHLFLGLSLIAGVDIILNAIYLQGCLRSDASFSQNLNTIFNCITLLTIVLLLIIFYLLFPTSQAVLGNLQRNSFAIYIVHYTIVTWLQFGMIKLDILSLDKPFLVVFLAIPISWLAADLWRRLLKQVNGEFFHQFWYSKIT